MSLLYASSLQNTYMIPCVGDWMGDIYKKDVDIQLNALKLLLLIRLISDEHRPQFTIISNYNITKTRIISD